MSNNDEHPLSDAQHANRVTQPRSADGSIDGIGTNIPTGLHRPANTATPDALTPSNISPDRKSFLAAMQTAGDFGSTSHAERWAKAIFNAARHRALEHDDVAYRELTPVVKVGEAPEVQVAEMMWSGDYLARMTMFTSYLQTWDRNGFFTKVAQEADVQRDDTEIEAATSAFFAALKGQLGATADTQLPNLGELQPLWDNA